MVNLLNDNATTTSPKKIPRGKRRIKQNYPHIRSRYVKSNNTSKPISVNSPTHKKFNKSNNDIASFSEMHIEETTSHMRPY